MIQRKPTYIVKIDNRDGKCKRTRTRDRGAKLKAYVAGTQSEDKIKAGL